MSEWVAAWVSVWCQWMSGWVSERAIEGASGVKE